MMTALLFVSFQHVNSTTVKLIVIDNVLLVPSNSYIMISQIVSYNARQLRRGQINGKYVGSLSTFFHHQFCYSISLVLFPCEKK